MGEPVKLSDNLVSGTDQQGQPKGEWSAAGVLRFCRGSLRGRDAGFWAAAGV